MIIDLRYHIASLVAVFLALGIGILIGTTMLSNDTLVEQQKQLTDKLTLQLGELREKNEAVQAQANTLEIDNNVQKEFEKQVLPILIQGKLQGKRIAIIETNSYGFPDTLINALQTAGASVESITTILDGFQLGEKEQQIRTHFGWQNLNEDEIVSKLAVETARGVVSGDSKGAISYLTQADLIKLNGNSGVPVDAVIVFGGSQDEKMVKTNTLDLPMIDYFLTSKLPVMGVEESGALYSYMKEYQKKRISTVDNIDTIPGQYALILAIAGQPGHYGIKSTAHRLMPVIEQPEVNNVNRKVSFGTSTRL